MASDTRLERTDKGEQSARGGEIHFRFAGQAFLQQGRAFVVQTAAAHVDGLDPCFEAFQRGGFVGVDQQVIVLDEPPERPKRQADGGNRAIRGIAQIETEPAFLQRKAQQQGTRTAGQGEPVLLLEVVDRLGAIGFLGDRKPAWRLTLDDDPHQARRARVRGIRLGEGGLTGQSWSACFSNPSFSIRPSVPPLMGRSSASDMMVVIGSQIAAVSHREGWYQVSTANISGITT